MKVGGVIKRAGLSRLILLAADYDKASVNDNLVSGQDFGWF